MKKVLKDKQIEIKKKGKIEAPPSSGIKRNEFDGG